MVFLRAQWRNLALLQFPVPDGLLLPHLPPGAELDRRAGSAWVSLVAFDFLDTRVLGIPWPGFRDFPEINLRFYVRHGGQRGVTFVRELVPSRLIAAMARWSYNEPYRAVPMTSGATCDADTLRVRHEVECGGRAHSIEVQADAAAVPADPDGAEHFFKEHQWGFGVSRSGETLRYEVRHPHWRIHRVQRWGLHWDWAGVYGPEWGWLTGVEPASVILAEGSAVEVHVHGHADR